MSLLTVFTAPKPFTDPHIAVIQRNALRSWQLLGPEVEVVLLGNDPGVAEAAAEFDARHIPDVACNEQGVPYIDSMFERTRQVSDSPVLAIINTDILLFPHLLEVVKVIVQNFPEFVLVGRRWDLEVTEPLDFNREYEADLKAEIKIRGRLQDPTASDYFIFSRSVLKDVPNFTIGRAGWDNWMIHESMRRGWPIMDATGEITIVHQNHDYHHLPGGQPHYRHPESKRNVTLGGGAHQMSDQRDLKYDLRQGKAVRKPVTWPLFVRRLERWLEPAGTPRGARGRLFRAVRRYRKRLRYD